MGGALELTDTSGGLSGVRVGEAFDGFDGLSRRTRIRYDTPSYRGLVCAEESAGHAP